MSEEFASWNILSDLTKISCPELIIQGDKDEFATDEHGFQIASANDKSAQAEIFDDCGHFPYNEKAILTIETILKFI